MYSGSKPVKCLFPQEKDTLKTPGKGTLTLVPLLGIFRWIVGFEWDLGGAIAPVRQLEC
jgi:hypothetical protein